MAGVGGEGAILTGRSLSALDGVLVSHFFYASFHMLYTDLVLICFM